MAGIYNIVYRYLFDRRSDLALPTSFLLNRDGMIVKVYQGPVDPARLLDDCEIGSRVLPPIVCGKRFPFAGTLFQGAFQRNDFTYGVALFQHGYLEQAEASFKQVIAAKPDDPEAYYNLGTLYLRRNALPDARRISRTGGEAASGLSGSLEQSRHGRRAGRSGGRGHPQFSAAHCSQRPTYTTALLNLGKLYRRQGNLADAAKTSEPRSRN